MLAKWTMFMIKIKWIVVFIWVVAAAFMFFSAPKLSDVLKTDQASFLSSDSRTVKADAFVKSVFPGEEGHTSYTFVAYRDKGKLTSKDEEYIKQIGKYIDKYTTKFRTLEVTSPYTNEALKDQLISKDGKTALLNLNVNANSYSEAGTEVLNNAKNLVSNPQLDFGTYTVKKPDGLEIYVTGSAAIAAEEHSTSNESMVWVTKITIILLLLILILIYRSPLAPLLPLFTVGLSFLISRGVIGYLTDFGFKVSSFTETFMIAVLFGAGTDYCMLIISRFKEELSDGKTKNQALIDAIPNTGEAIISSGGTVVIGFLFMIFAKFGLFNTTGPSVAIGVIIAILAVLTLIPALISILGAAIFWPSKNIHTHKDRLHEGFWAKLAFYVTARPIRFLIISCIFFVPFIFSATGMVISYDSMKDLPAENNSIRGFSIISEHFSQGELMPITVTLKSDKNLRETVSLRVIDSIAENLLKVKNVDTVRTASRPLGSKITESSLGKQISMLSESMEKVNEGFDPIKDGLVKIQDAISQVEGGIKAGGNGISTTMSNSINSLQSGVSSSVDGLDKLEQGTGSASGSVKLISEGLTKLAAATAQTNEGLKNSSGAIGNSIVLLEGLVKTQPELQKDVSYLTALGTLKKVLEGYDAMQKGLAQIDEGITKSSGGLVQTGAGLDSIKGGIHSASSGLTQIEAGLGKFKEGTKKAGNDLAKAADALNSINNGFTPLIKGLNDMQTGFSKINEATSSYTGEHGVSDDFFLPSDVFEKYPDFKKAVDVYISKDGHGAKFEIILSATPYSTKAIDTIPEIEKTVAFSLKNSKLDGATFAMTGVTSTYNEIRNFISSDMTVIIICVLLGIFVILAILLKSLVAPIYLILTIVLSYVSTLGITYLIFCRILGQDGLHWSVPFFSFCVLVALGVDYNIFLMSRVKEEYVPGDMRMSVTRALATTGGIITSCGLIMAGTFGAMLTSSLRPMTQIGFAACFGLIIDTFIIRTIVVPAISVLIGEMNWWPGRKVQVSSFARNEVKK
jgi:RND superfamily putative drug exporter